MPKRRPCENPFCFIHTKNPNVIQENFTSFLDGEAAFEAFSCLMVETLGPPPPQPCVGGQPIALLDLDELLRQHGRAA